MGWCVIAAIGQGWAADAWVEVGWASGAWAAAEVSEDEEPVTTRLGGAGIVKRTKKDRKWPPIEHFDLELMDLLKKSLISGRKVRRGS